MRTTVLSRSLIAMATLAVASAALAAVPATAATASGITRDQVLTAAAGVRAAADGPKSTATDRALRGLANRACAVDPDYEFAYMVDGIATQAGGNADGLMVFAAIVDISTVTDSSTPPRACIFGAVATSDPAFSLTGNATLNVQTSSTHALSGDVFATPARTLPIDGNTELTGTLSFTASGNTTKATSTKVSTPKTPKQKKVAQKARAKSLKSAKASYVKALKKAGNSKTKKAAAKKAYSTKKTKAKARYATAVATYKIVNGTEARPFAISATEPLEEARSALLN